MTIGGIYKKKKKNPPHIITAVVDLTFWSCAFTASSSVTAACLVKAVRACWPTKPLSLSLSFVAVETGSVYVNGPREGEAGAAATSAGGSVPRSS